jgi:PhnB protein
MGDVSLDPYVFFKGNCREAMDFYKSVFGGELTMSSYKEAMGEMEGAGEHPDWIMHSKLEGDVSFMASDTEKASAKAAKIDLSLSGSDEAKLKKYFDALSEGGNVQMPLEKQFWGDTFGMLTDKYGIEWMINVNAAKE